MQNLSSVFFGWSCAELNYYFPLYLNVLPDIICNNDIRLLICGNILELGCELESSGAVVFWLSLMHSFIPQSLNSYFAQVSLSKICEGENLWERSRLEIICKHLSSINHPTKRIPHHQHHHRHHHHHHRQTYDVRWTGGQEIEFLTSMQEKRKLFYLIACITLMLLVRKWVGLSLIKNRLLRCWGCLFLLNWIGTLAISMPGLLILIATWICWMSYINGCI